MQLDIRAYQPTDEESVIALWRECGLVVPQNDPERDIRLKMQVQPELFLVGDKVAASVMAGYEGHRGWLNYLAVSPAFRRQGLGRRMVGDALAFARAIVLHFPNLSPLPRKPILCPPHAFFPGLPPCCAA